MPNEEVNAWASYENTSRAPRALTRRTNHAQIRQPRRSIPEHVLRESLQQINPKDIEVGLEADITTAGATERKYTSEYGANWSEMFNLDASGHRSIASSGGRSRVSSRLRPTHTQSVDEQSRSSAMTAEEKQEMKFSDRTKAIFGVYFADLQNKQSQDLDVANDSNGVNIWSFIYSFNGTMPWLPTYIDRHMPFPQLFLFVEMCLRGVGQVYFQNNPMSGLLILSGLFVQSSRVAVHGLLSLVSGNLLAILLGFDQGLMHSGLFGYNSVLVGLALATFYSDDKHDDYYWAVIIGAIFMGGLSTVLFVMMGKLLVPYKSPPLTLPFNVATLLFLLATAVMEHVDMDPVRTPALPAYNTREGTGSLDGKDFFAGVVRGVGQVYLANNLAAGMLILSGIAVCSRIAALATLTGSAVGAAIAIATGVPADMVRDGMYGFNASLTFTAMLMFYAPSVGASIMGVFAAMATVVGQEALSTYLLPYGLPFMTLPFCVIALPFIIIQGTTSVVVAVPLVSMTIPEDHMRRVNMLRDGFAFLIEAIESEDRQATIRYGKSASKRMRSLRKSVMIKPQASNDNKNQKKSYSCLGSNDELEIERWVRNTAVLIFQKIDTEKTGCITFQQFKSYLESVDLSEEAGIDFAGKAFALIDLDDSETLELDEFLAFAYVSRELEHVKGMIAKFFDFVDMDGNGDIDFDELDAALEYLGEPALSDVHHERLSLLCGGDSFDIVHIINFVTVSKLKTLVIDFHLDKKEDSLSTTDHEDISGRIHSAQ